MKKVKVYSDKGVDHKSIPQLLNELSYWTTSPIFQQELIHTSWESDTDLLIIPGGRDVPYHQALKGKGNKKIREFVENGGSFLGICAGAYYGCSTIEFDLGMDLEELGFRELAFFPGIARGPAYGPGSFRYHSEWGAQAALISNCFKNESLRSYYNGGCYFVDAGCYSNVKIISKYLDIEGQPAAIIKILIGKGCVILSGVHIEMGSRYRPSTLRKEMIQTLEPFEEERKSFFFHILDQLINCE